MRESAPQAWGRTSSVTAAEGVGPGTGPAGHRHVTGKVLGLVIGWRQSHGAVRRACGHGELGGRAVGLLHPGGADLERRAAGSVAEPAGDGAKVDAAASRMRTGTPARVRPPWRPSALAPVSAEIPVYCRLPDLALAARAFVRFEGVDGSVVAIEWEECADEEDHCPGQRNG